MVNVPIVTPFQPHATNRQLRRFLSKGSMPLGETQNAVRSCLIVVGIGVERYCCLCGHAWLSKTKLSKDTIVA